MLGGWWGVWAEREGRSGENGAFEGRDKTYVGDADETREQQRCNPGDLRRAQRRPGETEEPDGFEGGGVEEPVEAAFGWHGVWPVFAHEGLVALEEGHEGEPGDEVAD